MSIPLFKATASAAAAGAGDAVRPVELDSGRKSGENSQVDGDSGGVKKWDDARESMGDTGVEYDGVDGRLIGLKTRRG